VGTVASPTATPVDTAGLVVREGWSLDWWIGADDRWHLPAREADRFPRFPLPVARLARLAVDVRCQRQGIGELLLADALQRCLRLSEQIGMIGVIVDAKDEIARGWYERFEFERLPDAPLTLWLPTGAIARL